MRTAEAQAELALVARLFSLQLESELSALRRMAGEADPARPPDALLQAVHRLAGSSLTFGYSEFGARLQGIETQLRAAEAGEASAQAALAALTSLRPPAAAASAEAPPVPQAARAPLAERSASAPMHVEPAPPLTGRPRAVLLDPFGWLPPAIDSIVEAYGFQALRMENAAPLGDADLMIECTIAPARPGPSDGIRDLILVCPRDGFHERLSAVRRNARALLALPVDTHALERQIQAAAADRRPAPYRALLVDDDALTLRNYRIALEARGIEAHLLDTPSRLFETIESVRPDVLVLDLNLPDCSGLELARAIRLSNHWLQMPILFLSAQRSLELEALTTAGEEFLSKPISAELLVAQIVSRARRSRALASGLSRDGLTGLLRQDDACRRLEAAAAQARADGKPLSIATLDIDHFKKVNDTHGHATGDMVLRALAGILRRRLRGSDFAGRMGGEEFLIAFDDCSITDARMLVDRMRREFSQIEFEGPGSRWHCSFSAGIAGLEEQENSTALLKRADQALYLAKSNGRARSELAGPRSPG